MLDNNEINFKSQELTKFIWYIAFLQKKTINNQQLPKLQIITKDLSLLLE
jgi:hypothetical protein